MPSLHETLSMIPNTKEKKIKESKGKAEERTKKQSKEKDMEERRKQERKKKHLLSTCKTHNGLNITQFDKNSRLGGCRGEMDLELRLMQKNKYLRL